MPSHRASIGRPQERRPTPGPRPQSWPAAWKRWEGLPSRRPQAAEARRPRRPLLPSTRPLPATGAQELPAWTRAVPFPARRPEPCPAAPQALPQQDAAGARTHRGADSGAGGRICRRCARRSLRLRCAPLSFCPQTTQKASLRWCCLGPTPELGSLIKDDVPPQVRPEAIPRFKLSAALPAAQTGTAARAFQAVPGSTDRETACLGHQAPGPASADRGRTTRGGGMTAGGFRRRGAHSSVAPWLATSPAPLCCDALTDELVRALQAHPRTWRGRGWVRRRRTAQAPAQPLPA